MYSITYYGTSESRNSEDCSGNRSASPFQPELGIFVGGGMTIELVRLFAD